MDIKLNLLPPYRKDKIIQAQRLRILVNLEVSILFVIIMFIVFLVSLGKVLEMNLQSMTDNPIFKNDNARYEKMKELEREFSLINVQAKEISLIEDDQLYWSRILLLLNTKVFDGIEISGLSTKNYYLFLVGKAADREKLIRFKDDLSQDGCFSEVNLPLSNLVAKDNIDFQIDLTIKGDCLKKQ